MSLLDLAERSVKRAIKEGAGQAEAFVQRSKIVSLVIERNYVKSCDVKYDQGITVRAFLKGGMGFAYTQLVDEKAADDVGERSVKLSKQAHPDPDFVSLIEPKKAPTVAGLYDKELAEVEIDRVIGMANELVNAARSTTGDILINGDMSIVVDQRALANSLGLEVEEMATFISMYAMGIVWRAGDVGSYFDFDLGRSLKDVKPYELGEKVARRAPEYLNAKKVETKALSVILGFTPTFYLITSVIGLAANAENVQRERSFLTNRLGESVASEYVTIVDDGTIPGGVFSSTYDGEGTPRKRNVVIEGGILRTYLHNSYTANKAKVETTANAFRPDYRTPVTIYSSNVRISPHDWSFDEMISDVREGIYFEAGLLNADPVTGSISTTIDFGFKIERGELAYPIKNALIGSTALEMLKGVNAVSKEVREEVGIALPIIRVKEVQIAGAI